MRYVLSEASSITQLNNRINEGLANGWKLYGNPVLAFSEHGSIRGYAQAMTLDEKEFDTTE